jgi:hypothetical protein
MGVNFIEAKPAAVTYEDLTQFDDVPSAELFGQEDIKIFTVWGLTIQDERFTKVMFYQDHNYDDECAGIVIPNSNVLEINYLEPKVIKIREQ